jgi:hypothetical protein
MNNVCQLKKIMLGEGGLKGSQGMAAVCSLGEAVTFLLYWGQEIISILVTISSSSATMRFGSVLVISSFIYMRKFGKFFSLYLCAFLFISLFN